jgi:hypothetical protein
MTNRLKLRLNRIEHQICPPRVITYTVTLGASKAERERRLLEAAGEMGIGPNDTVVQLFELADRRNPDQN